LVRAKARNILIIVCDLIIFIAFIILCINVPNLMKKLYPLTILGAFLLLIYRNLKKKKNKTRIKS